MSAIPSAPLPNVGRRRQSRLQVRLPARLITLGGTHCAVLADLSEGGARVTGDVSGVRVGGQAVLQWDRYETFGLIVWVGTGQCGLAFYDPITERDVLRTRVVDERDRLPGDVEQTRRAAQAFVSGRPMGGFGKKKAL